MVILSAKQVKSFSNRMSMKVVQVMKFCKTNFHMSKTILWEVFLSIISIIMVVSWLRTGIPVSYAEDGLYFAVKGFRPPQLFAQVWFYNRGAGSLLPFAGADVTFTWFYSLVSLVSFGNPATEEMIFFSIIIWIQGTFTFLSTRLIVKNNDFIAPMFASLAYIFNPWIMTEVWKRFVYPDIAFSALVPITLYMFLKALTSGNVLKYAMLFSFASFLL